MFSEYSCVRPGNIADSTSSHIGNGVSYQCNPGFYMASGTSYRSCKDDGTWTGQAPVCKSITIY